MLLLKSKIGTFKSKKILPFNMAEQNLVVGAVYPFDRFGKDSGLIIPAGEYFPKMGEIAALYFPLRNRIQLYPRHNETSATVDQLIAGHLEWDGQGSFHFLDVGGSTGKRITDIERRLGVNLEKHLLEIDPISFKEGIAKGIDSRVLDIAKDAFPYADGSIDAAGIFWVMEHLSPKSQEHVIQEIARVLKKGGILYLQDDKVGVDQKRRGYYERWLKPKGYGIGTFFLGIFEPTGLPHELGENNSIHPASNLDPGYRLVAGPIYGSAFTLESLMALTEKYFELENLKLIGFQDEKNAGTVLAEGISEAERFAEKPADLFAILRRR